MRSNFTRALRLPSVSTLPKIIDSSYDTNNYVNQSFIKAKQVALEDNVSDTGKAKKMKMTFRSKKLFPNS